LVFLNTYRNNLQAHGSTVVTFHPKVFRVSYSLHGIEVFLLAKSSKDNTRIVDKGKEGFLWLYGLRTDKLYFYLLTSGTGAHLICQAILAYSSTPYPDVGDYKGWTWLSPPAAYPSTMEYEANEGSL
jgi:hypothetical protein